MFEVTDSKLEMRSNKVWDDETAGLPGLVENNNGREIKATATKTNEDARVGSLADAEAVQAATDQRRGKEVTKEIYFGHLVS